MCVCLQPAHSVVTIFFFFILAAFWLCVFIIGGTFQANILFLIEYTRRVKSRSRQFFVFLLFFSFGFLVFEVANEILVENFALTEWLFRYFYNFCAHLQDTSKRCARSNNFQHLFGGVVRLLCAHCVSHRFLKRICLLPT